MNRSDFILIGIYKSKNGNMIKEYTRLPRQSKVVIESKEQATKRLRAEYQALDIFEQADKSDHYKSICESEGIDFFLLMCKQSHFDYLVKNDLIERF